MMLEPAGPRFPRPLVVTIGAMKSGTSSLHQWMDLHPEVSMSARKELNYFTRPKPLPGGMRTYRLLLSGRGRIVGESSVNYTKHTLFPGVPERMHTEVPRARLIYVLRDPIRRTVSHYRHNLSHGRERRGIRDALSNFAGNNYVATSRYYEQLTKFLEWFDREQVLIVDFAELRDAPATAMERIFRFIGVDPDFRHDDFGKVYHDSSRKGRPNALGAPIANIPVVRHLRYALPSIFEAPLDPPTLPDDLRAALAEHLRHDVEAIRAESGLPFASWQI